MQQTITIARPPAEVFAYVADPAHLRDWLPQLRREESSLPDQGLTADTATHTVSWSFAPEGRWQVEGVDGLTRLHLSLHSETARPTDPTERETPHDALAHGMEAALQSLKSHIERAGGGDPDLRMPDISERAYGHNPTQDR